VHVFEIPSNIINNFNIMTKLQKNKSFEVHYKFLNMRGKSTEVYNFRVKCIFFLICFFNNFAQHVREIINVLWPLPPHVAQEVYQTRYLQSFYSSKRQTPHTRIHTIIIILKIPHYF
jgi:hypothetical protein